MLWMTKILNHDDEVALGIQSTRQIYCSCLEFGIY